MPIKFLPKYSISSKMAHNLMRIEAAKTEVLHLPLTSTVLATLRETARLYTTHYSTLIEGNRLNPEQIELILKHEEHFPGRERDEAEVKGYYSALAQVEHWVMRKIPITEKMIQTLHALVMGNGKTHLKPTGYRDGQNVIKDMRTRAIVYMPPEAKDVPALMQGLIEWFKDNQALPCPLIAGIAHYQFATIHPYYDGNGRTARLLTTLLLHLGGYDLKGLYSLEEYYAKGLNAYYDAISVGPSHNYYMGRVEADITKWIEYFIEGMAVSFENVLRRMSEAKNRGQLDQSSLIRSLDARQRKVLELFRKNELINSGDIAMLFGFKPRTASSLCHQWVKGSFLEIADPSNKGRKYRLGKKYTGLINNDDAI